MDLLKFNYQNLHESVWNCHRIAWTVTDIFIPALFAIQAYFVKDFQTLSIIQAVMGFILTETLLIIWLLIMRTLEHYNEVRLGKLEEIEGILRSRSGTFAQYTLPYKERPKEFKLSPTRIYRIIFYTYTIVSLLVVMLCIIV